MQENKSTARKKQTNNETKERRNQRNTKTDKK